MTTQDSQPFDASKYLRKLSGKDYLEVKWRLLWLRTEHPDAVIETEMIDHHPGEGLAIFKARVALATGGVATGWGSETAADFRDYIEKAETKAIGRALAALGFGTQFCDDHMFDPSDSGRVVDSPTPIRGRQQAPPPRQPEPKQTDTPGGLPPCDLPGATPIELTNGKWVWRYPVDCPEHHKPVLSPDGKRFGHSYTDSDGNASSCYLKVPDGAA